MDAGIKVSSFDSAPNKGSRQVFVNQAGTVAVGQALMDAVLDITGALDEKFTAADVEYTITEADDGGTEIVLGEPLQFNAENIEEMAKLY